MYSSAKGSSVGFITSHSCTFRCLVAAKTQLPKEDQPICLGTRCRWSVDPLVQGFSMNTHSLPERGPDRSCEVSENLCPEPLHVYFLTPDQSKPQVLGGDGWGKGALLLARKALSHFKGACTQKGEEFLAVLIILAPKLQRSVFTDDAHCGPLECSVSHQPSVRKAKKNFQIGWWIRSHICKIKGGLEKRLRIRRFYSYKRNS